MVVRMLGRLQIVKCNGWRQIEGLQNQMNLNQVFDENEQRTRW